MLVVEAQNEFGDRLKVIREQSRKGFVRAANKGLRLEGRIAADVPK